MPSGCSVACDYFFKLARPVCIVDGYYYKPIGTIQVWTAGMAQCQSICKDNLNCYHFSYWPNNHSCVQHDILLGGTRAYLYNVSEECDITSGTTSVADRDCPGDKVMSGPKSCDAQSYDFYPDLSRAKGPLDAFDEQQMPSVAIVEAKTTSTSKDEPSIVPSGYGEGSSDNMEQYAGKGHESSREIAVQRCNADPHCSGIYKGGQDQWRFLCPGTEGNMTYVECCAPECRSTESLPSSYCMDPIYRKDQVAERSAGAGRGILASLWPLPWWGVCLVTFLVVGFCAMLYLRMDSEPSDPSMSATRKKKRKTRHTTLEEEEKDGDDEHSRLLEEDDDKVVAASSPAAQSGGEDAPIRPALCLQGVPNLLFDLLDRNKDGYLTRDELGFLDSPHTLQVPRYQSFVMPQAAPLPPPRVAYTVVHMPQVIQQGMQFLPSWPGGWPGWQPQSYIWPAGPQPRQYEALRQYEYPGQPSLVQEPIAQAQSFVDHRGPL